VILRGFWLAGLMAAPLAAQEAPEDGVIGSCMRQGNSAELCICASLVLKAREGAQRYARYGEIEDRLAAISDGAEAGEGEENALLSEGYRYFVPHGQAISVCAAKIAAGE